MKLSHKNKMRLYKQKFSMMYSHYDDDDEDMEGDWWFLLGVAVFIIGIWWGFVHLLDMFTFNVMPWWIEPFTIFPVGSYFVVADFYGRNPMHWWPIVWGTKVTLPEREPFRAYDDEFEKVVKELGPTRIYVVDYNTIKFRTKKDATLFYLKNRL